MDSDDDYESFNRKFEVPTTALFTLIFVYIQINTMITRYVISLSKRSVGKIVVLVSLYQNVHIFNSADYVRKNYDSIYHASMIIFPYACAYLNVFLNLYNACSYQDRS